MTGAVDKGDSRVWRSVDENAELVTRYLDQLSSLVEEIKRKLTDKLNLVSGQRVLEIGCGNGRDAEYMAAKVAPQGHVIAVDASAELINQAAARTASLALPLEFRVADAHRLPFPDDNFDAVRIERVLQHVEDPYLVVREMVRVVRSGGCIAALEPDWETISAAGGSVNVLRALRRYHADVLTKNGSIGRDLPYLFQKADCRAIVAEGFAFTTQSLDVADTVMNLDACLKGAVAQGWTTEEEASKWWEEAAARDKSGGFFASGCAAILLITVG
jgi:ubiquinone/menaquinone biosynthesis C-methylase UbiE